MNQPNRNVMGAAGGTIVLDAGRELARRLLGANPKARGKPARHAFFLDRIP